MGVMPLTASGRSQSRMREEILAKRYLKKDDRDNPVETPDEMFRRVAESILGEGEGAEEMFRLMSQGVFLPNSPTLMNAGRTLGQLSACFVLPVEDSMEAIFDSLKHTALIHKSGGGTGFSFTRLRPKDSRVGSTGGVASGPLSFMKIFNAATEQVKQGGTRRGANMGILRVDHPDTEAFVEAKAEPGVLENFNLSVGVTDAFMEAVNRGESWDLVAPHTGEVVKSIEARELFERIVARAWGNGDPGIVFLDTMNRANPTPHVGEFEATNPCAEVSLLPYESCNLGSINLSWFVNGPGNIEFKELEHVVRRAVRFLDAVIDKTRYPLPQIEAATKGNRKIGLGVMGFADMLVKMSISYASEEALQVADEVMGFVNKTARCESSRLGDEFGNFINHDGSVYGCDGVGEPMRNATRTCIAPTGTLSIIAGVSSGIEPIFALVYEREAAGEKYFEAHPLFREVAESRGFWSEALAERIFENGGSVAGLSEVPEDVQHRFVIARDVPAAQHIAIQAAFQKHTDNAVSKTVNFPFDATEADVASVYRMAHETGCKGVTIYRDGSRKGQIIRTTASVKNNGGGSPSMGGNGENEAVGITLPERRQRPMVLSGETYKLPIGCNNIYVTVNNDKATGTPYEMFVRAQKSGSCIESQNQALGRAVSIGLRHGVPAKAYVKQLQDIKCSRPCVSAGISTSSCGDAVAKVLMMHLGMDINGRDAMAHQTGLQDVCPDCGSSPLVHESGCVLCSECGFEQCS